MRIQSVKREDGGEFRISRSFDEDLTEAVRYHHPCDESACDIAIALRHDRPNVAAFLLSSAIECYTVDAVIRAHAFNDTLPDGPSPWEHAFIHSAEFQDWAELYQDVTRPCPKCEARVEFRDSLTCSNCLATLPDEDEDADD